MFENSSYFKIQSSNERSFGFVFTIFFVIIGLFPLWYDGNIRIWACVTAFIFLFFSIFLPKVLIIPNKLWFKFGIFLGYIVAPITMGIIFFLAVTPTGIIMRLLGKDLLNQRFDKAKKSSWIKRKDSLASMRNQF